MIALYNVCYLQMILCYSTLPKMVSSKLDRFSDACSVTGMKISTTKTEAMCLSRQPRQCSLEIDGVPLKQSEKFKYLGASFTSDGRQNSELDIRIAKASAVMRPLHRSVVLKRELCTRAKLSIFRSVYVPIRTYGHEWSIMNEKVRSRVQAAEIGFLRRISGLTLLDKVKSADIRESLNLELLLLRLERSQLHWSSSSSFGGASLPRQMGGPRPRVYPFTTLATKLLGSDADCKGLQPASCFVIQNHLSATWPSGTGRRWQILRDGFDSRLEPIAFDIFNGWLLTRRAQAHFAVSLNYR